MCKPSDENSLEVLFHSKNGYILRCHNCETYHIAFGNIAIDHKEEHFSAFANIIHLHCQRLFGSPDRQVKEVYIQTPFQGFRLLFSIEELRQLNDMLQEVNLLLEAERIVNSTG